MKNIFLSLLLVLATLFGYTQDTPPGKSNVATTDQTFLRLRNPSVVSDTTLYYGYSVTEGAVSTGQDKRWTTLVSKENLTFEINRGIGGTLLQFLYTGDSSMVERIKTMPKYRSGFRNLIVEEGINDCLQDFTALQFENEYKRLLDSIIIKKGWPASKIILMTPSIIGYVASEAKGKSDLKLFADAVIRVAQTKGTGFVNSFDYMSNNGGQTLISPDSIHPTDLGHAAIAQAFLNKYGQSDNFTGPVSVNTDVRIFNRFSLNGVSPFYVEIASKNFSNKSYHPLENQRLSSTSSPTFAALGVSQFVNMYGQIDFYSNSDQNLNFKNAAGIIQHQIRSIKSNPFGSQFNGIYVQNSVTGKVLNISDNGKLIYDGKIVSPNPTFTAVNIVDFLNVFSNSDFYSNHNQGIFFRDSLGVERHAVRSVKFYPSGNVLNDVYLQNTLTSKYLNISDNGNLYYNGPSAFAGNITSYKGNLPTEVVVRSQLDSLGTKIVNTESSTNKQNSLSPDGTNQKYPTVSAVVGALAGVNLQSVTTNGATSNVAITLFGGQLASVDATNNNRLNLYSSVVPYAPAIQASNAANASVKDLLLNPFGGNIGVGLSTAPGAKMEVNGNIIAATPTAANHLATKGYVDGLTGSGSSGIYTATASNLSGTTGVTATNMLYLKIANIVYVSGYISAAGTGSGNRSFDLSLPIATTNASITSLMLPDPVGTDQGTKGIVYGTGTVARFSYTQVSTANSGVSFYVNFTYRIQ